MQVTPSQLVTLLTAAIPARLPVLVTGKPGVGKTDIGKLVADLIEYFPVITHPVVEDPTDRKGIPWPDAATKTCHWLTDEVTKYLCTTEVDTLWIIDDLGQASPATQAVHMQWLLNRGVNGHHLSDKVSIIACTNGRGDRAAVSGILEPVKSRFASIVELVPDIDSWSNWAFGAGIPATLIAFLRFRPDLLSNFQPTADMSNSPMPRTWANLAKLETLGLPAQVETAAMAGAVGEGAAVEYIAFRRMFQSLTSIDAILLDPSGCKLPTAPNELYATCTALASKATDVNLAHIGVYAQRLVDASRGEFAVLLMRDCIRRTPKLQYTDAFIRISSGPLGQLISGMEQ